MVLEISKFFLFVSILPARCGDIPFFLMGNGKNIRIGHFINQHSSVRACFNFYDYSCSKWIADTTKPEYELSWNHFTAASYEIKKKVRQILESPAENSNPLLQQAQRFYNACNHFGNHEDQYLIDMRTLINYFKGWPIAKPKWSGRTYDWLEEVAKITKKLGFHPVIKFSVGIDYKNTDKYILYIEPGTLVFPHSLLLNPSQFPLESTAYKEWISQSIKYLFNESSQSKNFHEEVRKIIDFERKLAKFMSIRSTMERDTIEYFSKKFKVNLFKICKVLFSELRVFKISDTIIIRNYAYFKNLVVLLKRISNRKVANYLIWAIVKEFSRDTTTHLQKLNFLIDRTVLGITSDISREIECTNKAIDYFSVAILPKYLALYLQNDVTKNVHEMAVNIKSEYVNLLEQNTWLTNETKMLAIEKVRNIQSVVGYSNWMINKTEIEQYYNKLTVSDNHFKNMIIVKQMKIERNFGLLGTTVTIPLWPTNVFDVNAYYSILQNLVFVPLGILQEPFYHENGPRIFNYGALGSLIGHEFSHSLDTTGRQANLYGKIEKWWPNEDISGYQLRSKCFEINKKQPTHILIMGENIADNVGLEISYKAYKKLKNIELEDVFWDLQDEKIFFLSYAQMWCEISDHLDLFSDEHTSVETRVNQAVSNNHQFNIIFKCAKNQSEKNICKLW